MRGTDTYMLTEKTGTMRYMAPEVYLGLSYNQKCDVYSFALVLWQCLTLIRPYESYGRQHMISLVYNGTERPPLDMEWSDSIRDILCKCWSRGLTERYDCRRILTVLSDEISF